MIAGRRYVESIASIQQLLRRQKDRHAFETALCRSSISSGLLGIVPIRMSTAASSSTCQQYNSNSCCCCYQTVANPISSSRARTWYKNVSLYTRAFAGCQILLSIIPSHITRVHVVLRTYIKFNCRTHAVRKYVHTYIYHISVAEVASRQMCSCVSLAQFHAHVIRDICATWKMITLFIIDVTGLQVVHIEYSEIDTIYMGVNRVQRVHAPVMECRYQETQSIVMYDPTKFLKKC